MNHIIGEKNFDKKSKANSEFPDSDENSISKNSPSFGGSKVNDSPIPESIDSFGDSDSDSCGKEECK